MQGQKTAGSARPQAATLNGFRRAAPLCEGPAAVSRSEAHSVFRLFYPCNPGAFGIFEEAQDALRKRYGGSLALARDSGGALRVALRLEMPTSDRTIDRDLDFTVSGAGFKLTLLSGMQSTYAITERPLSCTIENALSTCEGILSLAARLAEMAAPSSNVVEMHAARPSRPPPPSLRPDAAPAARAG
jgi:hypothetical protein